MFYACLHFPKLSVLPALALVVFPSEIPSSLLQNHCWFGSHVTSSEPFSASCPLHPQRSPSQPLEHTVFVFFTNLRSGRISRTKHLKMKCWMKEWMVLNTTCSLHDNGEKFIGSQLKPEKNRTVDYSWTWVAFTFYLLWIMLLWTFLYNFCGWALYLGCIPKKSKSRIT